MRIIRKKLAETLAKDRDGKIIPIDWDHSDLDHYVKSIADEFFKDKNFYNVLVKLVEEDYFNVIDDILDGAYVYGEPASWDGRDPATYDSGWSDIGYTGNYGDFDDIYIYQIFKVAIFFACQAEIPNLNVHSADPRINEIMELLGDDYAGPYGIHIAWWQSLDSDPEMDECLKQYFTEETIEYLRQSIMKHFDILSVRRYKNWNDFIEDFISVLNYDYNYELHERVDDYYG